MFRFRFGFLVLLVLLCGRMPGLAAAQPEPALRIGDVLTFNLPGEAVLNKDFQVDRSGSLELPEIGVVPVAGKSLPQAIGVVREALSRVYRNVERLTVTLKAHKLPVTVLGYVKKPGSLELSGDDNVQTAISEAGGLAPGAQLDKLQLRRGTRILEFDYKRYLDSGDVSILPRLEPLDVVFVPASPRIGNVQVEFDGKALAQVGDGAEDVSAVKVFGEVNTPASITYREGATIIDMIMRAGGVTRYAAVGQIRVINDGKPTLFNMTGYLDSGDKASLPPVQRGATIFVPRLQEDVTGSTDASWLRLPPTRAVQVLGSVNKPGRFEWSSEMSLFDLLAQAGGPGTQADIAHIQILNHVDDKTQTATFNMSDFLSRGGSMSSIPKIGAGSVVVVPELAHSQGDNKAQWVRQPAEQSIYVLGQVGVPGRYAFNDSLRFLDVVAAANGPTNSADLRNVRVSHRRGKGTQVSKVDLARYFEIGDDKLLPKVRPGDVIFIPDRNRDWTDTGNEANVRVLGAVAKPGRYRFSDNMTILDLLAEAGGPTRDAYQEKILVVNMGGSSAQARAFNLTEFARTGNLEKVPTVRAGDTVYIPDAGQSDWSRLTKTLGEVLPAAAILAVMHAL